MNDIDIQLEIARLVQFGVERGLIDEEDRVQATNALLDLLQVPEPLEGGLSAGTDIPDSAVPILERILDDAAERGLLPANTTSYRDLMDARIMGLFTPRQSETGRRFWETAREDSIQAATDRFYRMSVDLNYIMMHRIRKNQYWLATTEYGDLEITINLSKPEKDPKDIAAERALPQARYPSCLLCVENVGYAGRLNHPARQNHRVIPLELDGEQWYFQYSPYVYYNEHCIIFKGTHTPMKISRLTFVRLMDFIRQFPHYFIGSNADLPIVGGSILSHDHFQGGRHRFAMEKAPVERSFTHPDFAGIRAGVVQWPMSVVRMTGSDPDKLIELADRLYEGWKAYSDPSADVLAESVKDGGRVPHNTVTPIARRAASGEYEFDLVLRNNRTTEEHPLGLFHPHQELHHIKKENIGLIEVMGLAVLPGRLKQELEQIREILTGDAGPSTSAAYSEDAGHPLHKHAEWIRSMQQRYGRMSDAEAEKALQKEVGEKFLQVLCDAGVYKRTTAGQAAFDRFMTHIGFEIA